MSSSPLPQTVLESIRHPVVSHNSYSLSPPFSAVSWNERRPKIDAHIPEWNSKSGDRPCSRLSKKPDRIPTWNSKMLEGRRRGRGGRWSSRRPPSHDWFWRSEAWAAKQNNTCLKVFFLCSTERLYESCHFMTSFHFNFRILSPRSTTRARTMGVLPLQYIVIKTHISHFWTISGLDHLQYY